MEKIDVLYSLGILIASSLLVAGFVTVCWRVASSSTRRRTSPPEPSTPISDERYAKLQAEMAELYSTLEKLTTTVKRISSRHGMADLRAREADAAPPPGTSKAELRKFYGIGVAGKVDG